VKLQYPLFFVGIKHMYAGYIYKPCMVRCADMTLHVLSPLHRLVCA
jgi:hypothetical protein